MASTFLLRPLAAMLRWLKRVFIFLIIVIYGRRNDRFLSEVKRHCRKRAKLRNVYGITELFDEVCTVPDNCIDDVTFTGFTKDGNAVLFRVAKADKEYAALSMDFPGLGRFSYSQARTLDLGAGPLKLQVLQPMRRWKIAFNGRLENSSENQDNDLLHVSVSLYWQCFTDPFDFCSCLSSWQHAKNLSGMVLDYTSLKQMITRESICYEQWGDMWGKVDIEGQESQFVRLKGVRQHRIERIGSSVGEEIISHHVIEDKGFSFHTNGVIRRPIACSAEKFGYVTLPVGERYVTDNSDLNAHTSKEKQNTLQYPFQVNANGRSFEFDNTIMRNIPLHIKTGAFDMSVNFAKLVINGQPAYGVNTRAAMLPFDRNADNAIDAILNDAKGDCSKLVLSFDDKDCRRTELVGGKAANLSILLGLDYTVPNGFSVTTNALKLQMDSQPELYSATERIKDEYRNTNTAERPAVCAKAVESWTDTNLNPAVANAIENELIRIFGKAHNERSFAVRSSAVSEDGAESSFAGQMESYLGIRGLDNILQAVRKCWASSYAYQAVEYRRQNGQPVTEEMSVVIQEMVDADVAGVLFTNDPVTGSTTTMVINAAPGLGETVVSGKCNPDTFKVRRTNEPNNLKVTTTDIGTIEFKLVCADDSGTKEVRAEETNRNEPCISSDNVLTLCRIGLEVEASLGHPQDIEWAISYGQIYLLQTRPITSQNEETNEELLHEFDSPLPTESELVTTCHVGEALPGCASTLTQDLFIQCASRAMCRFVGINVGVAFPQYANKAVLTYTNKPFMGMTAISVACDGFLQDKSSLDIAMVGRVLDEHKIDMIRSYKGGKLSIGKSLTAFANANFIQAPKSLKWYAKWEKTLESFTIGKKCSTAAELYAEIDEHLHLLFETWQNYSFVTSRSFIPFAIMYKMMRGKSITVSTEVNADMAVLMANCPKVYTADVPRSIQKLASAISASNLKETFLEVSDEEGHNCLMESEHAIRRSYEEFLQMHGHRCVKELEMIEKSWAADPRTLIRTLKKMIKSPVADSQPDPEPKSNSEIIGQLKSKLSWFQKFLLRTVILDKAKAGVATREAGRSLAVKASNVFKKAYWRLAEMMVREGRLPEERLLFFMTHIEIATLLETRSAALIRKARRRMAVLRQQESIRYPRMNFGIPKPISEDQQRTNEASLTVTGMPVGKGVATGRACVVLTLEDADNIQNGDILICPFTDIGWSPYFPMISGLVTEMGGLISHGAVVAREVGIPCVVNAIDATMLFKTGDQVKIDGLAGVVQRLVYK